jgi:hypothetical protein
LPDTTVFLASLAKSHSGQLWWTIRSD